jgi:osmotically-inducible protein OsmY
MKLNFLKFFLIFLFLSSCIGTSSKGLLGTGVSIAFDPRTLGTQIDDSIMEKNLVARLTALNASYFLNIKVKIIDGRIFLTGKADTPEEKLIITKKAWEIKGARSVKNDIKIKEKFNFKRSAKDILITSQLRTAIKRSVLQIIRLILTKKKFMYMGLLLLKKKESSLFRRQKKF